MKEQQAEVDSIGTRQTEDINDILPTPEDFGSDYSNCFIDVL